MRQREPKDDLDLTPSPTSSLEQGRRTGTAENSLQPGDLQRMLGGGPASFSAGYLTAQRTIGNQAVQRLLSASVDLTPCDPLAEADAATIFPARYNKMSSPEDPHEQQAEMMADDPAQAMALFAGHDFSGVRIREDDHTDAIARGLGTAAFTVGDDIGVAHGRASVPVIAHELAHVVAQRAQPALQGTIWRAPPTNQREKQQQIATAKLAELKSHMTPDELFLTLSKNDMAPYRPRDPSEAKQLIAAGLDVPIDQISDLFARNWVAKGNIDAYGWKSAWQLAHPRDAQRALIFRKEMASKLWGEIRTDLETLGLDKADPNSKLGKAYALWLKGGKGDADMANAGSSADGLDPSQGAVGPRGAMSAMPRDPLQQKALAVMGRYDNADPVKLGKILAALMAPSEANDKLLDATAGVSRDGQEPKDYAGMTYVIAKGSSKDPRAQKTLLGRGIVVDAEKTEYVDPSDLAAKPKAALRLWTMRPESLWNRTATALSKTTFTRHTYVPELKRFVDQPSDQTVVAWLNPDELPKTGGSAAIKLEDRPDAYDQVNKKTLTLAGVTDETTAAETNRLVAIAHLFMGAFWQGNSTAVGEYATIPKYKKDKYNQEYETHADGTPIMTSKREYHNTRKVTDETLRQYDISQIIYPGDPERRRYYNPTDPHYPGMFTGEYFTTCVVTTRTILEAYGINVDVLGVGQGSGLMMSVHEDLTGKAPKPRDQELFKYFKETGAWIWARGEQGFVPEPGDLLVTGSYDPNTIHGKGRGTWTFQHVTLLAARTKNKNANNYTLMTQDGGAGDSRNLGEDKTSYTIRTYEPETEQITGAFPKELIGVWRTGVLLAALKQLPTLRPELWNELRKAPGWVNAWNASSALPKTTLIIDTHPRKK